MKKFQSATVISLFTFSATRNPVAVIPPIKEHGETPLFYTVLITVPHELLDLASLAVFYCPDDHRGISGFLHLNARRLVN